jgi:excisionase family DNA binding protein
MATAELPGLGKLLSVPEFAEYSGMKQQTIRVWLCHGKLRGLKLGGRRLISHHELSRLLQEGWKNESK